MRKLTNESPTLHAPAMSTTHFIFCYKTHVEEILSYRVEHIRSTVDVVPHQPELRLVLRNAESPVVLRGRRQVAVVGVVRRVVGSVQTVLLSVFQWTLLHTGLHVDSPPHRIRPHHLRFWLSCLATFALELELAANVCPEVQRPENPSNKEFPA